jgi:uncharacterized protein (DUF1697 family)
MRYVAFLRAINVGGHTVRMEALRRHFEAIGAANVETFIASGNVIFDTARRNASALERALEQHLAASLGFPVATFLRTMPEVAAIAAHCPFTASELTAGAAMYVAFLKNAPPESTKAAVAALRNPVDEFAILGRELYWRRRRDAGESMMAAGRVNVAVLGELTMRNVTTVRRLAAKYA